MPGPPRSSYRGREHLTGHRLLQEKAKKAPTPNTCSPRRTRHPNARCSVSCPPELRAPRRHFEHALDVGLGESSGCRDRGEGGTLQGRSRSRDQADWGSVLGRVWPPTWGAAGGTGQSRSEERGQEAGRPAGMRLRCGLRPSGHGPHARTRGTLRAAGAPRSKRSVTRGWGRQSSGAREAGGAGRERRAPNTSPRHLSSRSGSGGRCHGQCPAGTPAASAPVFSVSWAGVFFNPK